MVSPAWDPAKLRCAQDEERDRVTYTGWDKTKTFLEDVMQQQGPFDGIMGFSQVSIRRKRSLQSIPEPIHKSCHVCHGHLHAPHDVGAWSCLVTDCFSAVSQPKNMFQDLHPIRELIQARTELENFKMSQMNLTNQMM